MFLSKSLSESLLFFGHGDSGGGGLGVGAGVERERGSTDECGGVYSSHGSDHPIIQIAMKFMTMLYIAI